MNAISKESKIANLELWIAALRSGKYEQGEKRLRLGDRYCCLGVACDLFDATRWEHEDQMNYCYAGLSGAPPLEVGDAFGLDIDGHLTDTLVDMNDGLGKSFAEIADYIESQILPRVRAEQEQSA